MATETAGQTPTTTEPIHSRNGATVRIDHLDKRFDTVAAVQDVSFDIEAGEFITMLGPSGSGKTTTLMMIAGFEIPTSGEIYIDSSPVATIPPFRRNIGMVFQNYALFPHMTVAENIAFPLKMRKVDKATIERRVGEVLEAVRLPGYGRRYPRQLSGGQQQRIALARAIVFNPRVLLMDEPLGALDKKLREWLQLEIKRIHRELGTTFVYVTHDQEEALVLSDRIAVFNQGRIEQVGTGRELYDEPATLFVGKFIGESTTLRGDAETSGTETSLTVAGQKVVANDKLSGGRRPVILLRPEKLTLTAGSRPRADNQNSLAGNVSEAIYLGSGSKYQVTLRDGSVAIVRAPLEAEQFAIGDEVDLRWHVSDSMLLADDERADLTLT